MTVSNRGASARDLSRIGRAGALRSAVGTGARVAPRMATDDDVKAKPKARGKDTPLVPALPRDPKDDEAEAPATVLPAEQLGFQMRFEAGRALLALENRSAGV